MKLNIGKNDRAIRFVIGITLLAGLFLSYVSGITAIITGVIGGILLITGIAGFCPIYRMLGINQVVPKNH